MDNRQNLTNINWYPGHMAKTKRQIEENLKLIDIVFEVIDARIPYSSKNKDIERLIKAKPKILIMTKKDLCDEKETQKWVKYYENQGYTVILEDLINNYEENKINDNVKKIAQKINQARNQKGLKPRRIRILILGIPNVGKSTLINRLVRKKATNVGNKPGITKALEWIRINKDLELLDTPGILSPKLEEHEVALNLAATTAIKEEILDKEEIAIYIINKMFEKYPNQIKERYNLEENKDIIETLDKIAKKIGAIKNNESDYEKVYQRVIKDLKEGYLGKITLDQIKEPK